ncbi:hypothetical protein E2C01_064024 [Portunus trituberculatus]|uniref:Uncharacterized protein n=1 Tax=Portunus trituberculatus TaxID=210409 RepID=A0A5B7HI06_PORTR|nr:hypothetical protein [Portunus trituberculatus]
MPRDALNHPAIKGLASISGAVITYGAYVSGLYSETFLRLTTIFKEL